MRFGLIGYGLWGRHHAAAIAAAPDATLAAIACASKTTAAIATRDFPGVPVDVDYRALLARPDIDAVAVVVPNHLHAVVGAAALESGKHVLLEKPMAITLEGCDRLLAAARRSGCVLSIGHELRLSTQYGRVKALIEAGEIGAPGHVAFSLFRFPFRPGSQGWRYDPARVGSWILEEPVHFFDLIMWYFQNIGDPLSVLAVGSPGARGAGLTDSFTAILRFPGDAHAVVIQSIGDPLSVLAVGSPGARGAGLPDSFTAILRFPGDAHAVVTQTLAGFEYHQLLHVVGAEGSIRSWWSGALDRTVHPAFELRLDRRGKGGVETVPVGPSGELVELAEQARQVVAAFAQGRPLLSGEEARKRIVVCLAAEDSLAQRREIALRF